MIFEDVVYPVDLQQLLTHIYVDLNNSGQITHSTKTYCHSSDN